MVGGGSVVVGGAAVVTVCTSVVASSVTVSRTVRGTSPVELACGSSSSSTESPSATPASATAAATSTPSTRGSRLRGGRYWRRTTVPPAAVSKASRRPATSAAHEG